MELPYNTYRGLGTVQLFDRFGKLYYSYTPKSDQPFYFNVRPGSYQTKGDIVEIDEKMVYDIGALETWAMMPETIEVVFTDNGERASLYPKDGIMCLDVSFRVEPIFNIYFAFGHEIAHYKFPSKNGVRTKENEWNCDKFAAKFMLLEGFNPSQVLSAMIFNLGESPEHEYRFEKMIQFLNSLKTKFVYES